MAIRSFRDLSRRGRLHRFRDLAESALKHYNLGNNHLTLLRYFANTTYRVDTPGQAKETTEGPYLPDRYLLRILASNDWEKANGEMTWLAALSGEAGMPVPAPVPTMDGRLLLNVSTPGIPKGRIVSLMRWIDGRRITQRVVDAHARSMGRMAGRMHAFAAAWIPPQGFDRFTWDWESLLGGRDMNCSLAELVASMPVSLRQPFIDISCEARRVMASLGRQPDAFGMTHTDLCLQNILFKNGKFFPIDFEDCGFGYWLWDIAVALEDDPWTEAWQKRKDEFMAGYLPEHPLPETQIKLIDLFMAIDYASSLLWATAFIKDDPSRKGEYVKWRDENGSRMLRFLEH
jgi:Ser/Thr protein kinase RdoA (MazF antagonist)